MKKVVVAFHYFAKASKMFWCLRSSSYVPPDIHGEILTFTFTFTFVFPLKYKFYVTLIPKETFSMPLQGLLIK